MSVGREKRWVRILYGVCMVLLAIIALLAVYLAGNSYQECRVLCEEKGHSTGLVQGDDCICYKETERFKRK